MASPQRNIPRTSIDDVPLRGSDTVKDDRIGNIQLERNGFRQPPEGLPVHPPQERSDGRVGNTPFRRGRASPPPPAIERPIQDDGENREAASETQLKTKRQKYAESEGWFKKIAGKLAREGIDEVCITHAYAKTAGTEGDAKERRERFLTLLRTKGASTSQAILVYDTWERKTDYDRTKLAYARTLGNPQEVFQKVIIEEREALVSLQADDSLPAKAKWLFLRAKDDIAGWWLSQDKAKRRVLSTLVGANVALLRGSVGAAAFPVFAYIAERLAIGSASALAGQLVGAGMEKVYGQKKVEETFAAQKEAITNTIGTEGLSAAMLVRLENEYAARSKEYVSARSRRLYAKGAVMLATSFFVGGKMSAGMKHFESAFFGDSHVAARVLEHPNDTHESIIPHKMPPESTPTLAHEPGWHPRGAETPAGGAMKADEAIGAGRQTPPGEAAGASPAQPLKIAPTNQELYGTDTDEPSGALKSLLQRRDPFRPIETHPPVSSGEAPHAAAGAASEAGTTAGQTTHEANAPVAKATPHPEGEVVRTPHEETHAEAAAAGPTATPVPSVIEGSHIEGLAEFNKPGWWESKYEDASLLKKDEGIWHPVKRLLRLRAQDDPERFVREYNAHAEHYKWHPLRTEDLQDKAKIDEALNRETAARLVEEEHMRPGGGETRINRPGVHIRFDADDKIAIENEAKVTYEHEPEPPGAAGTAEHATPSAEFPAPSGGVELPTPEEISMMPKGTLWGMVRKQAQLAVDDDPERYGLNDGNYDQKAEEIVNEETMKAMRRLGYPNPGAATPAGMEAILDENGSVRLVEHTADTLPPTEAGAVGEHAPTESDLSPLPPEPKTPSAPAEGRAAEVRDAANRVFAEERARFSPEDFITSSPLTEYGASLAHTFGFESSAQLSVFRDAGVHGFLEIIPSRAQGLELIRTGGTIQWGEGDEAITLPVTENQIRLAEAIRSLRIPDDELREMAFGRLFSRMGGALRDAYGIMEPSQ